MEASQNPRQQQSNTAKAIVESIFRYRALLVDTIVGVMAVVVLYVVCAPRRYESEMNILVRNARPDLQITPERSNGVTQQQLEVTE